MKKDKVLIITSKDDAHADYVIDKVNGRNMGHRVLRLNTEDIVDNCSILFKDGRFDIHIKDSNRHIRSPEIQSVWFRRPKEITVNHDNSDAKEYIQMQANACLRGLYFCTHDSALWVNSLTSLHRARIKLQQLKAAIDLGFYVPRTIVSNLPDEVISFFDEIGTICTKSLEEPNFKLDGVLYPLLTRVIADKDDLINNKISIGKCPTLYQEYIEKRSDIRVIVIGNDVFATEILSQDNILSKHDFRGIAPKYLKHVIHKLPDEIVNMIRNFMKQQGLVFSALDFVLSQAGKYYFLENNANGQWLWIEGLTGVGISESLIHTLFDLQ